MAEGTEERYLEWLEREEEATSLDETIRASLDIEEAKRFLAKELGMEATDAQVDAFMRAGTVKYQVLPELGVGFERIEHSWGYQPTYRDLTTGRFISRTTVEQAVATLEL